ncbi:beta-galactosidase BgaS [Acidianus manzaensis]|uniref:Beta-galactosidase n=1 Tax=Acidianus manzaensis TaxID=282676 RepID=A0A1W6JYP4_9CREN|nr:beta-galactosidase BgaS [Acidianus manzaensis]ARM75441.1 beta-galactosidase [Acidianus manzaensis]
MIGFPNNFKFGWSQSGFQFEMGSSNSEDPNTDWYVWVHDKENIMSRIVSGDFPEDGANYWENYRIFHDNAERMHLKIARLGIEWSRIFPKPLPKPKDFKENEEDITEVEINENILREIDHYANKDAITHYREIFKDIKNREIHLILNLYHWPLPLWLHDPIRIRNGDLTGPMGWLSTRTVYEFARFSAYVAWKFDDLVDLYVTINEPNVVWGNSFIPSIKANLELRKKAFYNLVQAHARAYDAIKNISKKSVGIVYANTSFQPASENDIEAVEIAEYENRWMYFDAIIRGEIKKQEKIIREDLKNKVDWIGVNYYTRTVVKKIEDGYTRVNGYGHSCGPNSVSPSGFPCSDNGWEVAPEGLYDVLVKYWNRYHIHMYVTENGIADDMDYLRPYSLVSHIYQTNRAINEGADVRGYMHWSISDNYEWGVGFSMKFGLLKVDFPTKKLYWRPSAFVYREIAKNNGITDELEFLNRIPPVQLCRCKKEL